MKSQREMREREDGYLCDGNEQGVCVKLVVVRECGTELSLDIDTSSLSIRSHHITQL